MRSLLICEKMDNVSKEYKCLFINQPLAKEFAEGRLTVHLMPRKTSYRGEVVVCALDGTGCEPDYPDGCWLARAVLTDCKRVDALTDDERRSSDILLHTNTEWRRGWCYVLQDVRRLVEYPCYGEGFMTKELNVDDMVEYPTHVMLDDKGYRMIMAGVWKGKN